MKKKILSVLMGSLFVCSASAEVGNSGFRAGLDVNASYLASTNSRLPLDTSIGLGMGGHVGYDFNRYLGVVGSFSGVFLGPKYGGANVSAAALTLDLIGRYPLNDESAVYIDVGYGRMSTTASVNNYASSMVTLSKQNAVKLGAGFEYGNHNGRHGGRVGIETYDTGYTRAVSILVGPVWKF